MSNFFQSAGLADKLILFFASFFILLLSTFAGCKKNTFTSPAFPAATQTGANTMGAIINGTNFIVYTPPGALSPSLTSGYANHSFLITGDDPSTTGGVLSILIDGIQKPGTYPLANEIKNNTNQSWAYFLSVRPVGQQYYRTDSVNTGTVTITRFDTIKHIISGTFSMMPKRIPASASDTIANVQNGRFDVTYHP